MPNPRIDYYELFRPTTPPPKPKATPLLPSFPFKPLFCSTPKTQLAATYSRTDPRFRGYRTPPNHAPSLSGSSVPSAHSTPCSLSSIPESQTPDHPKTNADPSSLLAVARKSETLDTKGQKPYHSQVEETIHPMELLLDQGWLIATDESGPRSRKGCEKGYPLQRGESEVPLQNVKAESNDALLRWLAETNTVQGNTEVAACGGLDDFFDMFGPDSSNIEPFNEYSLEKSPKSLGSSPSSCTSPEETASEASFSSEWWDLGTSTHASYTPLSPILKDFHDKTVLEFLQSFRRWLGSIRNHSNGNSNDRAPAASSSMVGSSSSLASSSSSPRMEKQIFSGNNKRPPDEEEEDDDGLPPSKRSKIDLSDESCHRPLACPFAKNDPVRYRKCFGYTKMGTISRLK
jgi:hypothetical protein